MNVIQQASVAYCLQLSDEYRQLWLNTVIPQLGNWAEERGVFSEETLFSECPLFQGLSEVRSRELFRVAITQGIIERSAQFSRCYVRSLHYDDITAWQVAAELLDNEWKISFNLDGNLSFFKELHDDKIEAVSICFDRSREWLEPLIHAVCNVEGLSPKQLTERFRMQFFTTPCPKIVKSSDGSIFVLNPLNGTYTDGCMELAIEHLCFGKFEYEVLEP